MCLCIGVYTCILVSVCMCVYVCALMYMCVCACVGICPHRCNHLCVIISVYMCIHMPLCVSTRACVMHLCTSLCVHIYICACLYVCECECRGEATGRKCRQELRGSTLLPKHGCVSRSNCLLPRGTGPSEALERPCLAFWEKPAKLGPPRDCGNRSACAIKFHHFD